MNLEEAVKKLKDITPDDLLNCWEGGEEEYNAIQTVLRYIDNSISKDKIKEILKDLNSEYIKTEKDFDVIYKKENKDMQKFYTTRDLTNQLQMISWFEGILEEVL